MYHVAERRRSEAMPSSSRRFWRARTTVSSWLRAASARSARCWTSSSILAARYGSTQSHQMATAAAIAAAARTAKIALRGIVPVPADAERTERQHHQPRRGQLHRKLPEANDEDRGHERP